MLTNPRLFSEGENLTRFVCSKCMFSRKKEKKKARFYVNWGSVFAMRYVTEKEGRGDMQQKKKMMNIIFFSVDRAFPCARRQKQKGDRVKGQKKRSVFVTR